MSLGLLWRRVVDHRENVPDDPLTAEQVRAARGEFSAIHDAFVRLGRRFPAVLERVLARAVHGTPVEPLRADAAS
jgi:hypothetical protein